MKPLLSLVALLISVVLCGGCREVEAPAPGDVTDDKPPTAGETVSGDVRATGAPAPAD